MQLFRLFIFILFCCSSLQSNAQSFEQLSLELQKTAEDSLRQEIYFKLSFQQSRYDLTSCLAYADSALAIAQNIDDTYYQDLGDYYKGWKLSGVMGSEAVFKKGRKIRKLAIEG